MPYVNVHRCVNCDQKLSHIQVMYSNGRCPKCGYKGKYAGTIVDTTEVGEFIPASRLWFKFSREFLIGIVIGSAVVIIAKLLAGTL